VPCILRRQATVLTLSAYRAAHPFFLLGLGKAIFVCTVIDRGVAAPGAFHCDPGPALPASVSPFSMPLLCDKVAIQPPKALISPAGKRRPVWPSRMSCRCPPTSLATTGVWRAMALAVSRVLPIPSGLWIFWGVPRHASFHTPKESACAAYIRRRSHYRQPEFPGQAFWSCFLLAAAHEEKFDRPFRRVTIFQHGHRVEQDIKAFVNGKW